MADGSFFQPGAPPNPSSQVNGPFNLGCDFYTTVAGNTLKGVYFNKLSTDTGTHTATIYRTDTQAQVGQQAFSGETASGWQSLTLSTPIALTANLVYRVCVSHNTANYQAYTSFVGKTIGSGGAYVMTQIGYAIAGTGTGYPTSSFSGSYYAIDVLVDNVFTGLYASQDVAEVWSVDQPPLRVSQAVAEVWMQNQPPTALRASQDVAEVWVTDSGTPTELRASQILAEAWIGTTPPVGTRLRLSAQVI